MTDKQFWIMVTGCALFALFCAIMIITYIRRYLQTKEKIPLVFVAVYLVSAIALVSTIMSQALNLPRIGQERVSCTHSQTLTTLEGNSTPETVCLHWGWEVYTKHMNGDSSWAPVPNSP